MDSKMLKIAKEKAVIFLEKAGELEERAKDRTYWFAGCKESASVRRASMDLTRSLAELRKP